MRNPGNLHAASSPLCVSFESCSILTGEDKSKTGEVCRTCYGKRKDRGRKFNR